MIPQIDEVKLQLVTSRAQYIASSIHVVTLQAGATHGIVVTCTPGKHTWMSYTLRSSLAFWLLRTMR